MASQSTLPIYDRALDGQLIPLLRDLRAAGATYLDIVQTLERDHNIKVAVETIRRWLAAIEGGAR